VTLRALYWGVIDEATRYVRSSGADLWVAQAGTPGDFLQSRSILPLDIQPGIEGVRGVTHVSPLLSRPVGIHLGHRDADLFLLGIAAGSQVGWPSAIRNGRIVPGPGEVVVDRVFAKNFGIHAGDVLPIGANGLKVAEVVSGGNAFAYQFAWANASDVTALSGAQGFTSYFLVTTQGGDAKAVGQRIVSTVPDTQVFVGQELADKNADNLRQGFLPVLLVLVVVAFVVGTAIIGLIIYTATVEKTREYGVLKAIGFSNRRLYAVVFQQSLLAATAGFVAGCLLSVVLGPAIERIVPVFVTEIRWGDILFAGVGALGMAIVASFVPARPMARLDPAEVFRA
jgi:putative ABC transport system permease protein